MRHNGGNDSPVGGKEGEHKPRQHDVGDEIGHVGHRLHKGLEKFTAHLVEEQRQQDGQGELDEQAQDRQNHRVAEHVPEVIGIQKLLKVPKPHPFAGEHRRQPLEGGQVLKGDHIPRERDIPENQKVQESGQQEQV